MHSLQLMTVYCVAPGEVSGCSLAIYLGNVKMVHNGIKYGDMQLICAACSFLGRGVVPEDVRCSLIFSYPPSFW